MRAISADMRSRLLVKALIRSLKMLLGFLEKIDKGEEVKL